jgi:hypothetical protein
MGIHNLTSGVGPTRMWPETEARRGVNEVMSCLQHYLENYLTDEVKHINIFSDACPGQNCNRTMHYFLCASVKHGKYDGVTHYFPTRGYRFPPCDTDFSIIERIKYSTETVCCTLNDLA